MTAEAVVEMCAVENVFLEISQNLQKNRKTPVPETLF